MPSSEALEPNPDSPQDSIPQQNDFIPPRPKNLKSTTRMPVVGGSTSATAVVGGEESTDKPKATAVSERNSEFDKDQLREKWEEYKAIKKQHNIDRVVNILNQEFEVHETQITLKLTNLIQQDILEDFKAELLQHLRDTLDNDQIALDVDILKGDDAKMIYTNKEKFNHLADKNPKLKTLQERLGLDPDF